MEKLTVVDNPAASQFEARADGGAVVGFLTYDAEAADGAVVVMHSVVEPVFEGQGVGGRLASGALDLIRASGRQVVPLCPFVSAYIQRHAQYQDLVRPEQDSGRGE